MKVATIDWAANNVISKIMNIRDTKWWWSNIS